MNRFTGIVAASILACWAPAAGAGLLGKMAAGGAAAGSAASKNKTYDANTLRPGDLKMCLLIAHGIDTASEALKKQDKLLDEQREGLIASRKSYDAEAKRYQAGKGGQPDAAKVRAEQAKYNKGVNDFNAALDRLKVDQGKFKASCAGKRYFDSDLKAISHELPPEVRQELTAGR